MASTVVYEGVARRGRGDEEDGENKLFSGLKIWFSRAIPQRDWFVQNAEINGATVVSLEKQADILLVDHARKNQPAGTHSYRWLELSIRHGHLEDLAKHAIGMVSRAERPVGSITIASKGGRNPYTEEEDQFLWNMMKPFMDQGGSWKGNEIYKQIEQMRPRHTYQSWRDHWIKVTQFQKRQVTELVRENNVVHAAETRIQRLHEAAPTQRQAGATTTQMPSSKRPRMLVDGTEEAQARSSRVRTPAKRARSEEDEGRRETLTPQLERFRPAKRIQTAPDSLSSEIDSPIQTPQSERTSASVIRPPVELPSALRSGFTPKECKRLYQATKSILDAEPADLDKAWAGVAAKHPEHTAQEWQSFWQTTILPEYCRRRGKLVREVAPYLPKAEEKTVPASMDGGDLEDIQGSEAKTRPGTRMCTKCFITESDTWLHDKAGRPLCNECGHLLRRNGVLRASTARTETLEKSNEEQLPNNNTPGTPNTHASQPRAQTMQPPIPTPRKVDVGVQTSPIIPPREGEKRRDRSVSFEPESPSICRPPEPNEARKRSAGRSSQSTSQESSKGQPSSQGISSISQLQIEMAPLPSVSGEPTKCHEDGEAGRRSPERPESRLLSVKTRKRARLHDEPYAIEIPPTPEHHEPFSVSVAETPTSPTLRARRLRNERRAPAAESPLFVPEDSDEDQAGTSTDRAPSNSDRDSSPLLVELISEPDNRKSSFLQQNVEEDFSEGDASSEMYIFETAPDVSQDWETAPEVRGKHEARIETQALFERFDDEDDVLDDFALPEPEGGWEMINMPLPSRQEEQDVDAAPGQQAEPSHESDDVDSWIATQKGLHVDVVGLDSILHAAVEATSFDFFTASEVVKEMIKIQTKGKWKPGSTPAGVRLPSNMPGCWTAEDDDMLLGQNAREVDRVEKKHGKEDCNRRFEFLEVWLAA